MVNILDSIEAKKSVLHFSIDDSILCLEKLFLDNKKSIFDVELFKFLKKLHNEIDLHCTLYLFYSNKYFDLSTKPFDLSMVNDKYKKEFEKNSDWLKFGAHALNYQTPMNTQTIKESSETIQKIIESILHFAGEKSITQTWRPHFFMANLDICKIIKKHGVKIAFAPEDKRKIFTCLSPREINKLLKDRLYNDPKSGLLFIRSSHEIKSKQENIKALKEKIKQEIKKYKVFVIYTHEYEFVKKSVRNEITNLFRFIKRQGIEFIS
ncbi:MAG: hypothetical protein HQ541_03810 [Mariniphaga sp.]|nr:hypothetical protein [Mariniphaga sp.]